MGIFEGITHSEEIQELLNDAQTKYDNAKNRLESQKKSTTKSLEKLGKEKVRAWSTEMNKFLDSFGAFNNIQMVCRIDDDYEFLGKNETPNELMINMNNATYNANEIIKAGALSVGTGALVGIATYGGVAMFANASTGTAIASLNGIAKKNATLAWLGGGSIASGGAGIAGGTIVLGGVVIGAIAVVSGLIAGAQGKAKLAEARKVHAEAESAVSKMNVVITGMEGIQKVSDNYRDFLSKLSGLFTPYLHEMDSIASKYPKGEDGKVNFNALSEMEQKTLHLSWLLAQLYYHIISVPLLTDKGEVEPSSRRLLQKAQQDYAQLSGQANELENEKHKITELLAKSQKEFKVAFKNFYDTKKRTRDLLIDIGKRRIDLWEQSFYPFMVQLSNYENITVNNVYPYRVTDIPIEFIFESSSSVLSYINRLKISGKDGLGNTGLVEIALFGGEDFLSELDQLGDGRTDVNCVHRHDMSLWFTGELEPSIANNIMFGKVTNNDISAVKQVVDAISGRENLEQAMAIHKEVKDLSRRINVAISDFDSTTKRINRIEKELKKYNKIQNSFLQKIEGIRIKHQSQTECISYELLKESEKRVFEMAFVIAKIQYTILASCILDQSNGGYEDDSDSVIEIANSTYKAVIKDTFKDHDKKNVAVANVVWNDNANKALIAGFATSVICIVVMIAMLISGKLFGLIGIAGALISFPIFFYFRKMPKNKLFMWRCIRIITAVVVMSVAGIIGMVV